MRLIDADALLEKAKGAFDDRVVFVDDIAANREAAGKTVGWTTFPDIQTLLANTDL